MVPTSSSPATFTTHSIMPDREIIIDLALTAALATMGVLVAFWMTK